MAGAPGIYEARVGQKYRLMYERLPGDVLRNRVIGKHDQALRKLYDYWHLLIWQLSLQAGPS